MPEVAYKGQNRFIVQLAPRVLPGLEAKNKNVDLLRGSVKKDNLVETIGFVENSSLTTSPTYNFLGAAQGRMPGLNISFKQSGSMQAVYNWNVRNARTTMFMVDGIERDFYTMDPDQIESISGIKRRTFYSNVGAAFGSWCNQCDYQKRR